MTPKSTNPHVELEERLRFETLIADLSSKFVNLPAGEVDGEIEDTRHRAELAHLTRVTTLSELSGSLANELNQPLGIILSNAQAAQELLVQDSPDVAAVSEILADIVAADRRASARS